MQRQCTALASKNPAISLSYFILKDTVAHTRINFLAHGGIFLLLIMAFFQIWGSRNLFSLAIMFLLAIVALLPLTFRLSRVIWIHIVVRYEGPCNKIQKL